MAKNHQCKDGTFCTDKLEIIDFYSGTNSSDDQGPTPGFPHNTSLNLNSPLYPFVKKNDKGEEVWYTSNDCIDIEKQLVYTYSKGSLDKIVKKSLNNNDGIKLLSVSNINRAKVKGSFVVKVYSDNNELLGYCSVLNRWNTKYCVNCNNNIKIGFTFGLNKNNVYDIKKYKLILEQRNVNNEFDEEETYNIKIK